MIYSSHSGKWPFQWYCITLRTASKQKLYIYSLITSHLVSSWKLSLKATLTLIVIFITDLYLTHSISAIYCLYCNKERFREHKCMTPLRIYLSTKVLSFFRHETSFLFTLGYRGLTRVSEWLMQPAWQMIRIRKWIFSIFHVFFKLRKDLWCLY